MYGIPPDTAHLNVPWTKVLWFFLFLPAVIPISYDHLFCHTILVVNETRSYITGHWVIRTWCQALFIKYRLITQFGGRWWQVYLYSLLTTYTTCSCSTWSARGIIKHINLMVTLHAEHTQRSSVILQITAIHYNSCTIKLFSQYIRSVAPTKLHA